MLHADFSTPCKSLHTAARDGPSNSSNHLALRGWLQELTWPELGYSHIITSVLETLEKLENPSAPAKRKAPRKRARAKQAAASDHECLQDLDFQAEEDDATPAKRTKRSTRARWDAIKSATNDATDADESVEAAVPAGEKKKKPSRVACRFVRRKTSVGKNKTAKVAAEPADSVEDVEMHDMGEADAVCCYALLCFL